METNLLGEVVGVEKGLLLLPISRVGRSAAAAVGRTGKAHGRKVKLGQFALPRQQTMSRINSPVSKNEDKMLKGIAINREKFREHSKINNIRDLIVLGPEKLVTEHGV